MDTRTLDLRAPTPRSRARATHDEFHHTLVDRRRLPEPIGFHITIRLADDRPIATTKVARRVLARIVLSQGEHRGLLAFAPLTITFTSSWLPTELRRGPSRSMLKLRSGGSYVSAFDSIGPGFGLFTTSGMRTTRSTTLTGRTRGMSSASTAPAKARVCRTSSACAFSRPLSSLACGLISHGSTATSSPRSLRAA